MRKNAYTQYWKTIQCILSKINTKTKKFSYQLQLLTLFTQKIKAVHGIITNDKVKNQTKRVILKQTISITILKELTLFLYKNKNCYQFQYQLQILQKLT